MVTSFLVSAIRYWIEMKEKTKNGKPIRKPNDVRKILIRGDFMASLKEKSFYRLASAAGYRCTLIKRKGERYISVKALVKPTRKWWDKSEIKETELKWKDCDKVSLDKFAEWLTATGIPMGTAVMSEMLTLEPLGREEGEAQLDSWYHHLGIKNADLKEKGEQSPFSLFYFISSCTKSNMQLPKNGYKIYRRGIRCYNRYQKMRTLYALKCFTTAVGTKEFPAVSKSSVT